MESDSSLCTFYQDHTWSKQKEHVLYKAAGEPSSRLGQGSEPVVPDHKGKKAMRSKDIGGLSGSGKRDKGKGREPPSDGPRYPIPHESTLRMRFECPFYKQCPTRYSRCRGKGMSRISDVTTHIRRQHLLSPVTMVPGTSTEPGDLTCYCPRCRGEFVGFGGEGRLRSHSTQEPRCHVADIEQTGVMTLEEFDDLKRRLSPRNTDNSKWYIIWDKCFPRAPHPVSPYVEITIPRLQTAQVLVTDLETSYLGLYMSRNELTVIVNQSLDRISNGSLTASEPQIVASAEPPTQHQTVPYQPSNMFPTQTDVARALEFSFSPTAHQNIHHPDGSNYYEAFRMSAVDSFSTSDSVIQPNFPPGGASHEGYWDFDGNSVRWVAGYEGDHYE